MNIAMTIGIMIGLALGLLVCKLTACTIGGVSYLIALGLIDRAMLQHAMDVRRYYDSE